MSRLADALRKGQCLAATEGKRVTDDPTEEDLEEFANYLEEAQQQGWMNDLDQNDQAQQDFCGEHQRTQ